MADFPLPTRDGEAQRYLRSYRLRLPEADVRDGMQPNVEAYAVADMLMPVYARIAAAAKSHLLAGKTLDELKTIGAEEGITYHEAAGASGYVIARTSSGGGWIYLGDECKDRATGYRYVCAKSQLYTNGQSVPIVGFDTGPGTNQDADIVLEWSSTRSGVLPLASVGPDGLTGGRDAQTAEEYAADIVEGRRRRAAAGNDAEYQRVIMSTPGVRVEQAFTYPALFGAGTTGWCFTIKPSYPGGSRVPDAAQVALAEAWLAGQMPGDDFPIEIDLVDEDLSVSLGVTWSEGSRGWTNAAPWPSFAATGATPGPVLVGTVTSATVFQLVSSDYTSIRQPSAGIVLAVYDAAHAKFIRKQILSFTGTGPWVVTCDTTADGTDTSYTPVAGQSVCPWSDDLQSLVTPTTNYVGAMGPGEQVASPPDDGRCQRRSPTATTTRWPNQVTSRLSTKVAEQSSAVDSCDLLERTPTGASLGVYCVSSNILRLADLAVFPES